LNKTEAIVVLGASVLSDGQPSRALKRRIMTGVRAFHEGRGHSLIVSGGPLKHSMPEAVVMADIARQNGVGDEFLLVEPQARNTLENAAFAADLMKAAGWKTALVVTDAWHLERALWCFGHYRIEAEGYPVPDDFDPDPSLRRLGNRMREVAAREKYRWILTLKKVLQLGNNPE